MVNELGVLSEIKKILLIFDTLKVEAQVLLTKKKMVLLLPFHFTCRSRLRHTD